MSDDTSAGHDSGDDTAADRLSHQRWASALKRGEPLGLACAECSYVSGTPKAACVRCGSREVSTVALPATGTVYSKSTIEVAPGDQGSGYQIALVDLGDARLLGRIADGEHVDIDDDVTLTETYEYESDIVAVFEPA
jgi:uncharacterized OB-fold protein